MSSWLSNATGIHISPKRTYVDKGQLGRAALIAGGSALLGPMAGGVLSKIPGVSKIGAAASKIPGVSKIAGAGDWLKDKMGGISGGDWLSAAGEGIGGYLDYEQAGKTREEQARQFAETLKQRQAEAAMAAGQFDRNFAEDTRRADRSFLEDQTRFGRTQGNEEAQLNVQAQTALNKAPMADKAQALLLSRMGAAPTAFKPRDWTAKLSNIEGEATGGPADSLAAGQRAAAAYTPGAGGVDTSALKLLQQRMLAAGQPSAPQARPAMAPRPQLQLPATTEPNEEELMRPRGTMPTQRRPMAFR